VATYGSYVDSTWLLKATNMKTLKH